MLTAAGAELGYEAGGLDTPVSVWPDSGRPWRARLDPTSLNRETTHLRTACWIVIAYQSGMRDKEVRELRRDCAFTEPGDDGRIRYKLRGRVFKGRKLSGDDAEWVVLDVVHRAVAILLKLNDDPTHLFGYHRGDEVGYALLSMMFARLANFRDHLHELFSTPDGLFIPNDTGTRTGDDPDAGGGSEAQLPWHLTTSQFRRTLAWHIAHQPFGRRRRRPAVPARQDRHLRGIRRHVRLRLRRSGRRRGGRRQAGLPRRPLPPLERRPTLQRRRGTTHRRRVRPGTARTRRPARRGRQPRPAAHHAGPPDQDPAPRSPQRLIPPTGHRGLRQAGQRHSADRCRCSTCARPARTPAVALSTYHA
jgi:hypothetical protein